MQTQFKDRSIKTALAAAMLVAFVAVSGTAMAAATATSSFPVSATVIKSCIIDASAGLLFGNYDPTVSTDLDVDGTISTTCTNGATGVTVTLGQGVNLDASSTASVPLRQMKSGTTDFLKYNLYSDTGRTTVITEDGTNALSVTATGVAETVTVYGRVPKNQASVAGNYTDTVVATVNF